MNTPSSKRKITMSLNFLFAVLYASINAKMYLLLSQRTALKLYEILFSHMWSKWFSWDSTTSSRVDM